MTTTRILNIARASVILALVLFAPNVLCESHSEARRASVPRLPIKGESGLTTENIDMLLRVAAYEKGLFDSDGAVPALVHGYITRTTHTEGIERVVGLGLEKGTTDYESVRDAIGISAQMPLRQALRRLAIHQAAFEFATAGAVEKGMALDKAAALNFANQILHSDDPLQRLLSFYAWYHYATFGRDPNGLQLHRRAATAVAWDMSLSKRSMVLLTKHQEAMLHRLGHSFSDGFAQMSEPEGAEVEGLLREITKQLLKGSPKKSAS